MSRKGTALINNPDEPGRIDVHLDGIAVFSCRMLEAARLNIGQMLSSQDIERFRAQDAHRRSYGCAVRYLSTRPRSAKEVETHLKRKHFPAYAIQWAINKLCEQKYLDDHLFARLWVRERAKLKPPSRLALQQELKQI